MSLLDQIQSQKPRRGRPPGSVNKVKVADFCYVSVAEITAALDGAAKIPVPKHYAAVIRQISKDTKKYNTNIKINNVSVIKEDKNKESLVEGIDYEIERV